MRWTIWGLIQEETGAQCGGVAQALLGGAVTGLRDRYHTGIATAPRKVIARELTGERELERALACLGDLAQLHTGEFLVQRTLKGGSSLGVSYSPRVCLT